MLLVHQTHSQALPWGRLARIPFRTGALRFVKHVCWSLSLTPLWVLVLSSVEWGNLGTVNISGDLMKWGSEYIIAARGLFMSFLLAFCFHTICLSEMHGEAMVFFKERKLPDRFGRSWR